MTATEFLQTKCKYSSLPVDFDHLDMSLLCFLAGQFALSAEWARHPRPVKGITAPFWRALVDKARQRVADGQINVETV